MQSKHILLIIVLFSVTIFGQVDIYDSGGPLIPEQAAYDVTYYDLSLQVFPADSSIRGHVGITAKVVQPLDWFVIDLDTLLSIDRIVGKTGLSRNFDRQEGKVWINLETTRQAGEMISLQIYYHGKPHVAVRAPWDGGITWAKTKDGSPWIATTCQGEGADIWWPVKDHISDEPDSMGIHIRVPDPLFCATNGRLRSVEPHQDGTTTYHWFVSTPINNYNVALNIAPYLLIEDSYDGVAGDRFPVKFWVLPEDYKQARTFFPQIIEHLRYFEQTLGPYPFRADKYGVVQTRHLGMEHQSIIAYGAHFNNSAMTGKDWGFDALHHHELAHEWWGNLVTCSDWRDMWIHEGFGTYMQALYLEETQGIKKYHEYLKSIRDFWNIEPVAPLESKSAEEISVSSVYFKGAWILHTLRYLIGDDKMGQLLRRMAYPDPELENISDGKQVRFASTSDFLSLAESVYGKNLDWFFNVYLRHSRLPVLESEIENNQLKIYWKAPDDLDFPMPVDIQMGNEIRRLEVPSEGTVVKLPEGMDPIIDPDKWLLFQNPLPDEYYLDSSDLDYYVGTYETEFRNRKRTIEILKEGNSLYVKSRRYPKIQLFASSQTEFFTQVSDNIRIKFNLDANENIESVTYNIFPREVTYLKVNGDKVK